MSPRSRQVKVAAAIAVVFAVGAGAVGVNAAVTADPSWQEAHDGLVSGLNYLDHHSPAPSATPTVTPTPTPTVTPTTTVYRLVAGNSSVTDGAGNVWSSDAAYVVGSKTGLYSVTAPISGTTDDMLFQSERWENSGYHFPVTTGTFRVTVNEAELYYNSAGTRVFDIMAEGATVVANLDIWARAGGQYAATSVTFDVAVTDGSLDLAYVNHADDGKLDSIRIDRLGPDASSTPTPTATVPPPVVAGGLRSGLAWNSGAGTADIGTFETYRGSLTDVWDTWGSSDSWAGIEAIYPVHDYFNGYAGMMSFAMPPIPDSHGQTLDECASGGDASHYTTVATNLKNAGWGGTAAKPTFIRFGWEASGDWYQWGVGAAANGTVAQAEAKFVGCWKSAFTAFKAVSPYFKFDFNVGSAQGRNAVDMYPGDAFVDVVGTDWYDTHIDFNTQCNLGTATRPEGPCQFAAFARAHGKGFSTPEWGVHGTDTPSFIQGMRDLFAANADLMAGVKGYDAYFDLQGCTFQVTGGCNPQSSSLYKALF